MIYYIDQSGKMESAGRTALALANDETRTLSIEATEKQIAMRKVGRKFYKQDASMVGVRLFAYAAAQLVALVHEQDYVVIDMEYTGHENRIRQIIQRRLREWRVTMSADHIGFQCIGQHVEAHRAALAVYRGQREADHKLKAADLIP